MPPALNEQVKVVLYQRLTFNRKKTTTNKKKAAVEGSRLQINRSTTYSTRYLAAVLVTVKHCAKLPKVRKLR